MKNVQSLFCLCVIFLFLLSCNGTKKTVSNDASNSEKEKTAVVTPVLVQAETPPDPEVEPPVKPSTTSATVSANTAELDMLREVNLLRRNPAGYIPKIQEYLIYFEAENFESLAAEKATAQELIAELRNTKTLSELEYDEKLFLVAKDHGQFLKKRANLMISPHQGKNNSDQGTRVKNGTGLSESSENFGSSHANPKYQLISLLVDAGIAGRGHRKNIMDPRWNRAAFYSIGQIADFDGCWLQLFAKEKTSDVAVSNNTNTVSLSKATSLIAEANYMTAEEKEMLNEINLMRSAPSDYVRHVQSYLAKARSGEIMLIETIEKEVMVANELIGELNAMPPLSVLQPSARLYAVAKKHGQFLKQKGSLDLNPNPHAGIGGAGANTRIVAGAGMMSGGENYTALPAPTVRDVVVSLLVDAGIDGFGHRKTLLNPSWNYGVCHNFGATKSSGGIDMPNNWLQNFGEK